MISLKKAKELINNTPLSLENRKQVEEYLNIAQPDFFNSIWKNINNKNYLKVRDFINRLKK